MSVERTRCVIAPLSVGATLLLFSSFGRADIAGAEALFKEGRRLIDAGQTAAACEKFAESQRLDASSGTLLNLGKCHETLGKTATAWAEYLAAARLARAQGRTSQAEEAQRRADELQPNLSYLTVLVQTPVPGLEVYRSETKMEQASLGIRIPVDPGTVTIRARAVGYRDWSTTATVGAKADIQTLTVPPLEKESSVIAPPLASSVAPVASSSPISTPQSDAKTGTPTLAYVAGGVGMIGLAVGTTFGIMALSSYKKAEDSCPNRIGCSSDALDRRDNAGWQANLSNVGFGLGLVGVGVAAVLLLTSDTKPNKESSHTTVLQPAFGPNFGGVAAQGRF